MFILTMSRQYFSLETVISGIYAKVPIGMMMSPNSTLDVRMDFSLPQWSLDYECKLFRIDKMEVNSFQILLVIVTFYL